MDKKTKDKLILILDIIWVVAVGLLTYSSTNILLALLSALCAAGLFHLLDELLFAPLVYKFALFIKLCLKRYSTYRARYEVTISKAIDWLVSCKTHWGAESQADDMQNANTCEGLLAIRLANQHKVKSEIYKQAFSTIIQNTTINGLPSKSLQSPTVVCTSMLLCLVAMEKEEPTINFINYDTYEMIAQKLWNARTTMTGWGVYITKTPNENECSLANTYWALRALSKYSVGKTEAFREYLKMIYQRGSKSKFGFQPGDTPRLITTAMYLDLFYQLEGDIQDMLSITYDPKMALEYVYDQFVNHNQQLEFETLYGMKLNTSAGPTKSSWKHITIGYAISVLLTAIRNKELDLIKQNGLFRRIDKLIKENVRNDNAGYCYYLPKDMEHCHAGIFTFPTAYLIQGLSQIRYLK